MKSPFERLILVLAASQIPEDDVFDALKALEKMGASQVTKLVYSYRREIQSVGTHLLRGTEFGAPYLQVVEDIYRLLISEANIPATDAGRLLYLSLSRNSKSIPPFRAKEGFRRWLTQIAKKMPPSELLHHATKIRNQAVHNERATDWPLRSR